MTFPPLREKPSSAVFTIVLLHYFHLFLLADHSLSQTILLFNSFNPSDAILDFGQCRLLYRIDIFWNKFEETLLSLLKWITLLQIFSHPYLSFWENVSRWCRLLKSGVERVKHNPETLRGLCLNQFTFCQRSISLRCVRNTSWWFDHKNLVRFGSACDGQ
jgi:hypothetical protein